MSLLTNMITQMQATNLKFQGQRTLINNNFEMMRMANKAGPNMSKGDVFQLQSQEKQLMFGNIKAQTQIAFANAMLARADKLKEQDKKLGARLWAAGATFF